MLSRLSTRPRLALTFLVLATTGFAITFAENATKAPADFNNNTNCWGKIEKGTPDPDDPKAAAVKYTIRCDGKITGYSIVTAPERELIGAETEVSVTDGAGAVVPTDSFNCNATFPGWGLNCVSPAGGDYRTPYNYISSEFYVNRAICAEPRLDPILTVAYATVDSKGKAVQAMAGPFDLGHSIDCPKPKSYAKGKYTKRKIPVEQDTVLTGQEERRKK